MFRDFKFLSHYSMNFRYANRIAPDGTPRCAASHLGFTVCLCPIKGTPGLNELNRVLEQPDFNCNFLFSRFE